jgi:hypothetical protein
MAAVNLGLGSDGHGHLALAVLHRTDRLQQRDDVMPFDVVAGRMPKDLVQRLALVVVELGRFCRRFHRNSSFTSATGR